MKRQLVKPKARKGDVTKGSVESGAIFDPTEKFRYLLWREWDEQLPAICFIMLNPSTADEAKLDPTVTRCFNFAKRWKFGRMEVTNVFAYRSTDWRNLKRVKDPVGVNNDHYIIKSHERAQLTILAWGNHAEILQRGEAVIKLLTCIDGLHCFGITKVGQPRHPLYVKSTSKAVPLNVRTAMKLLGSV